MRRLAVGMAVVIAVAWGSVASVHGEEPQALTLNFLDAGQAHALHIQKGDLDIMVDAGRHYSGSIVEAVESMEGRLDLLIITHPHADHFGGAAGILEAIDVGVVATNGERRGPPRDNSTPVTWQQFEEALDAAGLSVQEWQQGQRFRVTEHLSLEVLASGGDFPNTSSGTHINDDSLVLMMEYQGRRVLLPGDLEEAGGRWMVDEHCEGEPQGCSALDSDIFLVPHHGSHHFDEGFFEAANPTWAVFGSPYDNRQHHHPRRETLGQLVEQGARIKSTNKGGGMNVEARIEAGGEVRWNVDDPQVFIWDTSEEPRGMVCQISASDEGPDKECQPHGE